MSTSRLIPDPADVAWWLGELRNPQGCLRPVPDRAGPLAVAAVVVVANAGPLGQLAAEANTESAAEPEPTPSRTRPQRRALT